MYGGSISERFPMTVVNSKGQQRAGYFTKKMTVDPKAQWDALIENLSQKYPSEQARTNQEDYEQRLKGLIKDLDPNKEGADQEKAYYESELQKIAQNKQQPQKLKNFINDYKAKIIEKHPKLADKSDSYFVHRFLHEATGDISRESLKNQSIKKLVEKTFRKYGIEPEAIEPGGNFTNDFCDGIIPIYLAAQMASASGHKVGDRVDQRSTAMSSVADLLGEGHLLAHATNMKLKDAHGNVTEGTFIDQAKGVDLYNHVECFTGVSDYPFDGTDGTALRQLADIQILDYLCGNVDRHFGNLTYEVNEQGKIIGIQGIDNDNTFGRFANGDKQQGLLAGVGDLGVISASMAEKIKNLDPAMLKFTLRGRGLSEAELDFSVRRLTDLKQAILEGEKYYGKESKTTDNLENPYPLTKGVLRVIPDKDFAKLNIRQLCMTDPLNPKQDLQNIFYEVESEMNRSLVMARKAGLTYNGELFSLSQKSPIVHTTDSAYTMDKFSGALRGVQNLVKTDDFDVDRLTVGSNGSKKFADMVKASKKLAQMKKDYDALEEQGINFSAAEYKYNQERLAKAVQELETTNDAYLAYKTKQRKAKHPSLIKPKNDYEKNRINHALDVRKYLKYLKERLPKPLDHPLTENEQAHFKAAAEQSRMNRQRAFHDEQVKNQNPPPAIHL